MHNEQSPATYIGCHQLPADDSLKIDGTEALRAGSPVPSLVAMPRGSPVPSLRYKCLSQHAWYKVRIPQDVMQATTLSGTVIIGGGYTNVETDLAITDAAVLSVNGGRQ